MCGQRGPHPVLPSLEKGPRNLRSPNAPRQGWYSAQLEILVLLPLLSNSTQLFERLTAWQTLERPAKAAVDSLDLSPWLDWAFLPPQVSPCCPPSSLLVIRFHLERQEFRRSQEVILTGSLASCWKPGKWPPRQELAITGPNKGSGCTLGLCELALHALSPAGGPAVQSRQQGPWWTLRPRWRSELPQYPPSLTAPTHWLHGARSLGLLFSASPMQRKPSLHTMSYPPLCVGLL